MSLELALRSLKRLCIHYWTVWRSDGMRGVFAHAKNIFVSVWGRVWMRFAGLSRVGRVATRLATWGAPPYKARRYLGGLYPHGYVAPSATIYHIDVQLGDYVFLGDRVMVFQAAGGGRVALGTRVSVYGDVLLETGQGGSITIGAGSRVHRGCHLIAYLAPIQIGCDVGIAQNCAFYSYNHGIAPGEPISKQPLQTRGPIVIDDHAWLGVGVIVLSGVRIGKGAVIGAGAVVTDDIPDGAIALGVPARVVKMRSDVVATEAPLLEYNLRESARE
jgi:acetyltransferase-like isoleucine patch superfamily enzyme